MIKELLVGVDGSDYSKAASYHACSLAKTHGARINGLAAADTAGVEHWYHQPKPLGAGSMDHEAYEKKLSETRSRAKNAAEDFKRICEERGVKYSVEVKEGDPAQHILQAAGLNDVLILGQRTCFSFEAEEGDYCDTWWDVLMQSRRPLILVPEKDREIKKVMIALDLQRLTDRLIYNYIHLDPYPGAEVHLMHAREKSEKQTEIPKEFIEYFKVHGFEVTSKVIYGDGAGQAIVDYAQAEEMNLLVLGVHTVSKVWSAIIGSTGKFVIEHLDIPIFTQT